MEGAGIGRPTGLREVSEAEASGAVARLYEEIRRALRSPNVNLIYRLLASRPEYLAAAWQQIGPNLASRYLEREAERLRGLAALEVGSAGASLRRGPEALGVGPADLDRIRAVVDLFNYANPKNLIVVTALRLAFDGRPIPGRGDAGDRQPVPEGPIPDVEVRLLDVDRVPPEVRALLAEIAAASATAGAMPSVYRALANWPAFLRASWPALRPFVVSPAFAARTRHLVAEAERSALALPYPVSLSTADTERLVGPDAARAIGTTLERFRSEMIPAMTVEIHTLKALLDGQPAAASSPLAWRP